VGIRGILGWHRMTITPTQTQTSNSNTKTITATTGPNHSLIVCIGSWGSGSSNVSAVTLGSANLALASHAIETSSDKSAWIWYLSGIASGQTAVAITEVNLQLSSGSGGVVIFEIPSLLALDTTKINSGHSTSGSWSSGATGTLSQLHEMVFGVADTGVATIASPSGWTNTKPAGNVSIAGYKEVTDGSTQTYNAASSTEWAAAIAPFKVLSPNQSAFLPLLRH
jgi:hypothetical protein